MEKNSFSFRFVFLVRVVRRKTFFERITSFVMIVVSKKIFVVNVVKVKTRRSSERQNENKRKDQTKCSFSRRPVPAVEEEREQAEFELDVKFLRERQRREF